MNYRPPQYSEVRSLTVDSVDPRRVETMGASLTSRQCQKGLPSSLGFDPDPLDPAVELNPDAISSTLEPQVAI